MEEEQRRAKLIENLKNITGASQDRANYHLEVSNWDLDKAVNHYYEEMDDGSDDDMNGMQPTIESSLKDAAAFKSILTSPTAIKNNSNSRKEPVRFATLGSLKQNKDDESSSGEEGQAYYAGGSESGGGQQILGPKKKKNNSDNLIESVFKKAKDLGAETIDTSIMSRPEKKKPWFTSKGNKLVDDGAQSSSLESPRSIVDLPEAEQSVNVVVKFWRNGFSIDDGPARDFHAPDSQYFLKELGEGKVPKELIHMARGNTIDVSMEDHRDQEYRAPPMSQLKPFSGLGHRLGNPIGTVLAGDEYVEFPKSILLPCHMTGASGQTSVMNNKIDLKPVVLDATLPSTSLQIRLPDGTKLTGKFNQSHRLTDVRQFINCSRPDLSGREYTMMTTFPNKVLTDESLTLEEAKLLNALIVVKFK